MSLVDLSKKLDLILSKLDKIENALTEHDARVQQLEDEIEVVNESLSEEIASMNEYAASLKDALDDVSDDVNSRYASLRSNIDDLSDNVNTTINEALEVVHIEIQQLDSAVADVLILK